MKEAANNTGPLSTTEAASVSDTLGVAASLRLHWPEYLMEAGEMSLMTVAPMAKLGPIHLSFR